MKTLAISTSTPTVLSTRIIKGAAVLDVIIRYSLKYRTPVLVISLILLVCGSYFTTTLPIDVFPDLDRPRVVLLTECPGLATEEVESLVTHPIELSLLSGNGVQAVRSQSTAGLSAVSYTHLTLPTICSV